jgi:iron-sulfur cluster repair protein YtfE (RIC family)
MTEAKGTSVNDPVAILKRDHREAAAMLKTLDGSKPGKRRQQTLAKLDAALRLHMEIEERIVYPAVARLVGEEYAEEAEIEHGLVRDTLDRLQTLVDEPGFGAAVAMLTAGVRHHVKEEESEVFPQLKQELDRDELRAMGDEVAAAKRGGARRR